MKRSTRLTLLLVVLTVLLVVGSANSALALECMGVGDVSAQCGCGGTVGCSYP